MKFKKYIVAGTLAVLLSTTAVSTLDGNKADASSKKDYIIQSEYHVKLDDNLFRLFSNLFVFKLTY